MFQLIFLFSLFCRSWQPLAAAELVERPGSPLPPAPGGVSEASPRADAPTSSHVFPVRSATELAVSAQPLVDDVTAFVLNPHQVKVGSDLEYGLKGNLLVGTSLANGVIGIPTFYSKMLLWQGVGQAVAVSVHLAWLDLSTLAPIAPAHRYYDELSAQYLRPAVSWSQELSPRLMLHTHWAIGIGSVRATLSEQSKRQSWQAKYPDGDYDTGEKTGHSGGDAEKKTDKNQDRAATTTSAISRRTLELQALLGLATDRFQVTGDYLRNNRQRILVSSRIDRLQLETLRAQTFRLTAAQEWCRGNFHFRLGVGAMYLSISGTDLDGEAASESGFTPVSELAFYWVL